MHEVEESGVDVFSFQDDPIQQRLLDAADEVCDKEIWNNHIRLNQLDNNSHVNLNNSLLFSIPTNNNEIDSSNVLKIKESQVNTIPFRGWIDNLDVAYRKTENEGQLKSKGSPSKENGIFREFKNKSQGSPVFIFRHYSDLGQYIAQYRRDHTFINTSSLPPAKSDLSDLRKLYQFNRNSPMTLAFQIGNGYQQNGTVPSLQQDKMLKHNREEPVWSVMEVIEKQYQIEQNLQQHLKNKQDKNRHPKNSSSQTNKKLLSPPTSEKVFKLSESSNGKGRSEKFLPKESVFIPSLGDISVEARVMKLHSSNFNLTPLRNMKPPRPWSPVGPDIRGQLTGQRNSYGINTSPKFLDTSTVGAGIRADKQSSGFQTISDSSKTQVELPCLISKACLNQQPSYTFVTCTHKGEGCPQISCRAGLPQHIIQRNDEVARWMEGDLNSSCSGHNNKSGKPPIEVDGEKSTQEGAGQNLCKVTKCGFECFPAHNEKILLSQNQRIKDVTDQSKLKCKLEQVLHLPKIKPVRNIPEIKSFQITYPFSAVAPCRNNNKNANNSDLDVSHKLCPCFVDFNINCSPGKEIPMHINGMSKTSLVMGELLDLTSNCKLASIDRGCCQEGYDKNKINKVGLLKNGMYTHSRGILRKPGHTGISGNTIWKNPVENNLPRTGHPLQTFVSKRYIDRLTKEVSAVFNSTVPKFQYSSCPLVNRSQSMDH